MTNNKYKYLRQLLLSYLNKYLSKPHLQMKIVMEGIQRRLERNQSITSKQFESIIKYIEREPRFNLMDRPSIRMYFQPLIEHPIHHQKEEPNDLTQFFV